MTPHVGQAPGVGDRGTDAGTGETGARGRGADAGDSRADASAGD